MKADEAPHVLSSLSEQCRFSVNRADYLRQFETVFMRPIRDGYDAVPVGNGDLAAIVWQPDHLTWMLNKCDISMEASQAGRLVFETPIPLADRLGRLETRLAMAAAAVEVKYTGGELGVNNGPKDAPSPERMGVWRGVYARLPNPGPGDLGTLCVKGYVPNGRNVLLIDYDETAHSPHPMRIRLERWVQPTWGDKAEAAVHGRILTISYDLKDGTRYAAAMAFDGFAGAVPSKTGPLQLALDVPAGTSTRGRLAIAVVTSHEADDPLAAAMRLAAETLAQDPAELKKGHDAFWTDFWNRSFVESGHPYANMLYHMALYELGITSRGRRPVKFNGALNLWNEKNRVWDGSYWCHNQHSLYLPVYAANHAELAGNFLEWIVNVRPEAVRAARELFGTDGAYYPETMSHEFDLAEARQWPKSQPELQYMLSSGTRYALLLWDRYRYTLDEAFLREKAYPVFRDVADFYVSYGKIGSDGHYHVEPSIAWETRPVGRDSHPDCAAWRTIFPIAIEVAVKLDIDRDRVKVWKERLRKAPPYPVDDGLFSVVMRKDGTPEPPDHFQWQVSNLSGIFPYGAIGLGSPGRQRRMAEATFERYRYNTDAGHEYLPIIAARLGLAEGWRGALFQFIQFFQNFDQGLFNYYNSAGNKDEESGNRQGLHPYLESSGIFAASVNEMLLQSHDGTIRVFPAAPERWHARFILRAAGSFLVASEHRGQAGVPYILIQPVDGGERECKVALPWPKGADLTAEGTSVPFCMRGRTLVFTAKPGVVYALMPSGTRLADVPIVKLELRRDGSPARIGMTWYGLREGANNHTISFPLW